MDKNLSQHFTNEQIVGFRYIPHGHGENGNALTSARTQGTSVRTHSVAHFTMKQAMDMQHHKACQLMPNDLHSVQWDALIKDSFMH